MSDPSLENPEDFIRHARTSWLAAKNGRVLHAVRDADWTEIQRGDMALLWMVRRVRMACGQAAELVTIPGPFSRMNSPRCSRCCRATGLPQGIGSPVNDPECRKLLGLPADEG